MPRAVIDENVSLQVVERLAAVGYDVHAVATHPGRGMSDEEVFALVAATEQVFLSPAIPTSPTLFGFRQIRREAFSTWSMEISEEQKKLNWWSSSSGGMLRNSLPAA